MGILDNQIFAVIIVMTFVTTLAAPPLLSAALRIPGIGTKKPVKDEAFSSTVWRFPSAVIAGLVVDTLLKDLRSEGFYIQMMNINEGICQARKDDISISITEKESAVTIETSKNDMPLVKTAVSEVILALNESVRGIRESSMIADQEISSEKTRRIPRLFSAIRPECVITNIKGTTMEEIITELVNILDANGRLVKRDDVLRDVLYRHNMTSATLKQGIAFPHAKSDGVRATEAAIGVKREGLAVGSDTVKLFILIVSPQKTAAPYLQLLASLRATLSIPEVRDKVINEDSKERIVSLLLTSE
jgi:mannitol/fructose-specific phosphotransferase system IIA component (Ntr-type)/energy-converting hydrogenase Eha subunit A